MAHLKTGKRIIGDNVFRVNHSLQLLKTRWPICVIFKFDSTLSPNYQYMALLLDGSSDCVAHKNSVAALTLKEGFTYLHDKFNKHKNCI